MAAILFRPLDVFNMNALTSQHLSLIIWSVDYWLHKLTPSVLESTQHQGLKVEECDNIYHTDLDLGENYPIKIRSEEFCWFEIESIKSGEVGSVIWITLRSLNQWLIRLNFHVVFDILFMETFYLGDTRDQSHN